METGVEMTQDNNTLYNSHLYANKHTRVESVEGKEMIQPRLEGVRPPYVTGALSAKTQSASLLTHSPVA